MLKNIEDEFNAHLKTAEKIFVVKNDLAEISALAIQTLKNGKKILLCGNGGSAADAQHIAAELTGRYKKERKGLNAISLSTDTSALTAIGNDYGYEYIFSRQVEAIAQKGDLLIGISTSGNSANIINAFKEAKEIGCVCIGFTGRDGGAMKQLCDVCLIIPSIDTARIQEMHILCGHTMCELIESSF